MENRCKRLYNNLIKYKGDVEIDATKVDNKKPLEDFDPETQVGFYSII